MEQKEEHGLGLATVQRSGELATVAMAAKAKALVEARYVMAYNRPRNFNGVRIELLAACKRPGFAEVARYKKPVGGGTVDGFSIRFTEEAIKAMRNIAVETSTLYEDDEKRTIQVNVTDLETNVTYGKDITINKHIERKTLKSGQVAIASRTNSKGEKVYIVEATEDDLANKIAAAESKTIRNSGLRLIPNDLLEECEKAIEETMHTGGKDAKASTKKVCDAFATLNIPPTELERYIGHSMATVSPKELTDLRAIFTAVRDGQASWQDYFTESKPAKADLAPKDEATAQTPQTRLAEFLDAAVVSVSDLMGYIASSGRDRKYKFEAGSLATVSELPTEFCLEILADTAYLAKLVRTFGAKPPQ